VIGVGARGPLAVAEATRVNRSQGRPDHAGWTGIDLSALDRESEVPHWIAISLVPGAGPVGFARLLRRFGSARAAWAAGPALLDSLARLPDDAAPALARLQREGVGRIASRILTATRRAGGSVVTALDDDYPTALSAADPRPPILYVAGDPASMAAPCVAMVGTRRASSYGRSVAAEIAAELAGAGVTVVSGLALGIDGASHEAAVIAGGRSVAVLPSPLDRIYPPRHRSLAARLVAGGGALVSELAPGAAPVDHGREVFAVPGPIDAVASRGCNRLIADHQATIVTSAAALLHRIGSVPAGRPVSVTSLSDLEAMVLHALLQRPASIEELIGRTDMTTGALASTLTLLEARGLVESYGGATFHPTLVARRIGRPTGLER
jgi:DNA processing protein